MLQSVFMKKIFALFCAVCLMPGFSAQAWIGGPFSGNSFFQAEDNDGVYEATASTLNGMGVYRFAVGNDNGTNLNPVNVNLGSMLPGYTNIWYYQGVQYFGSTIGTINSMSGRVIAMGTANDAMGLGTNSFVSAFKARLLHESKFIAATPFVGVGEANITTALGPGPIFKFTVLGSKVSYKLL